MMRRPRLYQIAADWMTKEDDSVAMIGGILRRRMRATLKTPTTTPTSTETRSPGTRRRFCSAMIFMATVPESVIVAGIERSTLPGPRVMTNICPMATITKNVAKVNATERTWPVPWPCVKAAVASQTAAAAIQANAQG